METKSCVAISDRKRKRENMEMGRIVLVNVSKCVSECRQVKITSVSVLHDFDPWRTLTEDYFVRTLNLVCN